MRIKDLYQGKEPVISFEFFPPRTEEGEGKLFETISSDLKKLNPSFVSVTYGAMGNTRANTIRIVSRIKNEVGIEGAAHLTCVGQTRDELESVLAQLVENRIENIVALRGDPPKGETEFKPVPNGFSYASELVSFIRSHPVYGNAFCLAVAGYPEGHPECDDKEKDLLNLKHKVEQGADVIMTQLFFDNDDFLRFVERLKGLGIDLPVIPGIMPVTQAQQIEKFATMCNAKIPAEIRQAIEKYGEDQASIREFGIEYATKQCRQLLENGVSGLHFYTLNQSKATRTIFRNLGLGHGGD